jgi:hypothetical protein
MRFVTLMVLATCASCGSSLAQPGAGDANQPALSDAGTGGLSDADCTMFNPVACRLDLAKTSVNIDVNYPNVVICRLQLLPTRDLTSTAGAAQLAAAWQVSLTGSARDQTILTAETPQGVLEYPLGAQQLYITRVTFSSRSADTIATLVEKAVGAGVSLYAIPLACPGQRPTP